MAIQLDGTNGISTSGNITAAGAISAGTFAVSNVSASGNVTGNYFIGNGSQLTGITAASSYGNSNVTALLADLGSNTILTTGTITAGNTTINGDLTVTGNATLSGNILADRIINGNSEIDIQVANGNANVTISGTTNVVVFATTGQYTTGVASVSGNITGGNIDTSGLISATGNITGNYFIGNGSQLTGITSSGGTGDFTFSANTISLPANTAGELNVTGYVDTTVTTTTSYTKDAFTGLWDVPGEGSGVNLSQGDSMNNYLIELFAQAPGLASNDPLGVLLTEIPVGTELTLNGGGYGPLAVVTLTVPFVYNVGTTSFRGTFAPVSGFNQSQSIYYLAFDTTVGGNVLTNFTYQFTQNGEFISDSALIGNVLITDDIITPVAYDSYGVAGTSTLTVNGNLDVTGNVTGNYILGNGIYLTGITAASSYGNSNVTALLADLGSNTILTTGNITGGNITTVGIANLATIQTTTITSTGSANVGNLDTGGTVSATGNVTGGNILTGGLISATGNITGANVISANTFIATGASGNITGANVISANTFIATGNVTGNYFIGNGSQLTGITSSGGTGDFTFSANTISLPANTAGELNVTGYVGNVLTGYSYQFTENGEFISDSALIGNVLITDDIITPITVNSYGVAGTGTLTVNGNLDVMGNILNDGVEFSTQIASDFAYKRLVTSSGQDTIGIGSGALANATVGYATNSYAFGANALASFTAAGGDNIAIGRGAASSLQSGTYNVFIGTDTALGLTTVFNKNTAIGAYAGPTYGGLQGTTCLGAEATSSNSDTVTIGRLATTPGQTSISIGYNAGASVAGSTNCIVIGKDANPSAPGVTAEITLGDSGITALRCQVTSITSLSDARDKKDITPLSAGLDFVSKLKPVAFAWNMRDGGKVDVQDTGFIAQDLQQAQQDTGITIPGLVYESNPDKLEASYGKLIPVLVKAIQDLQLEVKSLKSQLNK